jgi:hypothetical protein
MPWKAQQDANLDAFVPEPLGTAKIGKVDDEGGAGEFGPCPPDQPDRGERRPAGRDEIVNEVDPRARSAGVDMHGEPVGAIFERVIFGDRSAGKLTLLADEEYPGADPLGERSGEDEAPCLDSGDQIRPVIKPRGEPLDARCKARGIEKQGGDVPELDPRLGEIGDGADEGAKIGIAGLRALLGLAQPSTPRPAAAASALLCSRRAMFSGFSGPDALT